jgi:putative ABC transport system permease protein
MIWSNYLTVGLRNLARHRAYAFINLLGLAIGLAACILILLYVRYETGYDKWLPDWQRIYQVQSTWHEPGQPVTATQRGPLPLRDTLAAGFQEIEAVSVATPGRLLTVRAGQPVYVDALIVDPSFFDIFQLDFRRGSARTALANVTSVVLTRTEAIRQFGTVDALGRTITEKAGTVTTDYKVTGIVRDPPSNSHLKLATIFRFDPSMYDAATYRSWGTMDQLYYVKLRRGVDANRINAAFPAWEKRVITPQVVDGKVSSQADILDLKLVNVADIHLGAAQSGGLTPGSDAGTIETFAVIAAMILGMACINFVNLSTARAGQRAREVALRKVLGASRRQLIVQFLGESLLLVILAMLIGLAFVELSAPLVSRFLDIPLRLSYFGENGIFGLLIALILVAGAAGGIYPAFYLSRFQPAAVLKANRSNAEGPGSGRLRSVLVVLQFAISIGLIVCTIVIYAQTRFVQTVDPGFRRDGIIQIDDGFQLARGQNYEAFRHESLAVPGIVSVARTNLAIGSTNKTVLGVRAPGAPNETDIGFYKVDPDFFGTMGMRVLAGRTFSENFPKDIVVRPSTGLPANGPTAVERGLNVVINRRAAEQLGYRQPAEAIGKTVQIGLEGPITMPSTVVGVIENTRLRSARNEIEPMIFSDDPTRTNIVVLRYRNAVPTQVMMGLAQIWSRFVPDRPFGAVFAEDLVAKLYSEEQRRGALFLAFAALAVGIACLGLFGLAAFTAERRTREIGIRKVFGARIRDIVRLLTWQFSKPVVLANLVAWPVAWWVMRDWLDHYDVRIDLTPGPFLFAGLLALAIAIATVAGHAIRVARLNPIHALRYE